MEVLTSYIRTNSRLPKDINKLNGQQKIEALENQLNITIDIQSALIVISRREFNNDRDDQFLNLFDSNLKRANLEGANLRKINLYGANLQEANLAGANLYQTNLYNAYLREATLAVANLEEAYLHEAYLAGAYFTEANLKGAYLAGANLHKAYLEGANFEGANLYKTKSLDIKELKSAKNWEKAVYTKENWDDENYRWIPVDKEVNEAKIQEIRDSTEGMVKF